jgi:DNA-binding MarR family transcriptional regulator
MEKSNMIDVTKDVNGQLDLNKVGEKLCSIVNLKRKFADIEMKPFNLCRTEWRILCWLSMLGECLQKDLVNLLDIDGAHLTRVIDKLKDKGYVIRAQTKHDRRICYLSLTSDAYEKIVPRINQMHEKIDSILFAGFSLEEKQQLVIALDRLEQNLLQNI